MDLVFGRGIGEHVIRPVYQGGSSSRTQTAPADGSEQIQTCPRGVVRIELHGGLAIIYEVPMTDSLRRNVRPVVSKGLWIGDRCSSKKRGKMTGSVGWQPWGYINLFSSLYSTWHSFS